MRAFLDGDYGTWARATQKAHAQNLNRLKTAFKTLFGKRLDEVTGLDEERWRAGEIARGLSLETTNGISPQSRRCSIALSIGN